MKFRLRSFAWLPFVVTVLVPAAAVRAQSVAVEADMGRALEVDPYIKVPQRQVWSTGVAWRWHTWSKDTTGYAKAYNYPVISAGLMVTDYSRVRVKQPDFLPGREPSKLGTSWVGFVEFDWPVVRPSRNTSVSFALRNGLGRSTRTWHRENNPENELIGSPWSVYFGAAFYAAWQTGRWTLRVGPEFHHLSNGALARPNKGVNSVGLGVGAAYCIDGEREKVPDTKEPLVPFDDKGLFLELDWRTGLKTALGEWLVDKKNQNAGRPMTYGSYSLYVAYGVSAALMYRYDRRFASGIGLDLIHEPYLGRIEVQNPERPRSVQKQSWGISARHTFYYKRMQLRVAAGPYLSRPFGHWADTDEEFGFYERIGLSYNLPWLGRALSVGYDIHAHKTKAYLTEFSLSYRLPLKRKR